MPVFIEVLLKSRWFVLFARLVLTFVFWSGGLAGILDFQSRALEMHHAGLAPPEVYVVAVTIVELLGTILIVTNRHAWLGAGMLGVFLALTIPIGHPFWTRPEPMRTQEFFVVLEHISLIGGLMVAAVLGHLTDGTRHVKAKS